MIKMGRLGHRIRKRKRLIASIIAGFLAFIMVLSAVSMAIPFF